MITESREKNHDHVTIIKDRITKDNHVNKDLTTNANKFGDNVRGSQVCPIFKLRNLERYKKDSAKSKGNDTTSRETKPFYEFA